MAKKNFKDNPAMQYISMPEPEQPREIEKTINTNQEMSNSKYYKNPLYIETKSKRVQILMQPSLHKRIKLAAELNDRSFNEELHQALLSIYPPEN